MTLFPRFILNENLDICSSQNPDFEPNGVDTFNDEYFLNPTSTLFICDEKTIDKALVSNIAQAIKKPDFECKFLSFSKFNDLQKKFFNPDESSLLNLKLCILFSNEFNKSQALKISDKLLIETYGLNDISTDKVKKLELWNLLKNYVIDSP